MLKETNWKTVLKNVTRVIGVAGYLYWSVKEARYRPSFNIFEDFGGILQSTSAKSEAISTLYDTAVNSWSDANKLKCAQQIVELIDEESDEETKVYAIQKLRGISNDMWRSDSKNQVSDLIQKIAK